MDKRIKKIVSHTDVSEKAIERYLVCSVRALGGECLKYSNPGAVGYPDRVCLLPCGVTLWVELKGEDGHLAPVQKIRITKLLKLGHIVHVCGSRRDVDEMLNPYEPGAR